MNNHLDDLLTKYNPTSRLAEWDPAKHEDMLASIVGAAPTTDTSRASSARFRRARWVAAGCLGAAAAAIIPLMLPGGSPAGPSSAAAAALHRLAAIAGSQGPTVGPHQYGYTKTRGVGGAAVRQTWVAADDGQKWFTPSPGDNKACLYTEYVEYRNMTPPHKPSPQSGNYGSGSVADLEKLPTDPAKLARFIDKHPSGDLRGIDNRVESIGDLLRDSLTPPALRAAAVDVLADTPGMVVDTHSFDALGRPAIKVSQQDYVQYFDPNTSQLLEDYDGSVVLESRTADELPDMTQCINRLVESTIVYHGHKMAIIKPSR